MTSLRIILAALACCGALVLCYIDLSQPLSASLVHAWDSSFFLFLAAALCEWALRLTRRQYKLCCRFRTAARESGFLAMDESAPPAEKVRVMRALFASFPSTVSEMVHSQDEDHGQVFKALMLLAGVFTIRVEFDDLMPSVLGTSGSQPLSARVIMLNHLRFVGMVAGVFGFPLCPTPKGAFEMWKTTVAEIKTDGRLSDATGEAYIRHQTMNGLHRFFAMPLLLYLPFLELVALVAPLRTFASFAHGAYGAPLNWNEVAVAGAWLLVALTRLIVIVSVLTCFKVFVTNAMRGHILNSPQGFRVFWMEYAVALGFAHVMQLLAIGALFDFGSPSRFHGAPLLLRVLVGWLTLSRVALIGREALRNLRLARRDVEYTEADYVWAFNRWCAEEAASKAKLDENVREMARSILKEQEAATPEAEARPARPRRSARSPARYAKKA